MSLDAGTTSSRCILFNKKGEICSVAQQEFKQIYPKSGWVEHDPKEIWETQLSVCKKALANLGVTYKNIASIGITNQRETTVVWDKRTGKPLYNAIVWQCRRTSEYCDSLKKQGLTDTIRQKTGLVIDAYFSATKIRWILENVPDARKKANSDDLLFGTIDTWLIWNLTGGKVHAIDYSNASRTMLFNIHTLTWDEDILKILDIPESMLPTPMPSSGVFGITDEKLFGGAIKISGAAGDQQCALFGQTCFDAGSVKNTYGTGAFLLMNTGSKPIFSNNGLVTTIAWGIDGKIEYALEGSVFVAGASIQWLRDELNLIEKASDSEKSASAVDTTAGCYVVPAFTGLAAPYWDQYARGTIVGLTRGVNKNHIIRATLESIAYQVNDILSAMQSDIGVKLPNISVDGGAAVNNLLMQMQADISGFNVIRPKCIETTALGAAYLAGIAVGFWKDRYEIVENHTIDCTFYPEITDEERNKKISGWKKAVERSLYWEKNN